MRGGVFHPFRPGGRVVVGAVLRGVITGPALVRLVGARPPAAESA